MRRLIIDCQTKKESWQDLTPDEEAEALTQPDPDRRGVKALFLRLSLELKEMKANPLIFDADDIKAKQAELDKVKELL